MDTNNLTNKVKKANYQRAYYQSHKEEIDAKRRQKSSISEDNSLGYGSLDSVSEMSDAKYGRRLKDGFMLLNED